MSSSQLPGRIVTFYSYKGGTGRSMTLANVAWILASAGKRVLVVDWDLEAPGLHRYFHPFLQDKELTSSEGIIDFVVDFAAKAVTPAEKKDDDWYHPYTNIRRYASSLAWDFGPGTLDFVPAGRQGSDYATRVNSFNWEKFYNRLGGGIFLEAAKRSMAGYDYVLIDSRTGVSDTSGICTVQMPDLLVVCFTYNIQGIEGAAAVAESAVLQRQKPDGDPGLLVLPVPMRVEMAEKHKLDVAREAAQEKFDPFLSHLTPQQRDVYWGGIEVLYQPFYAYEEVLATFGDKPFQTKSLLASMETLTSYITDGAVGRMASLPEEKRQEVLAKYTRQRKPVKKAESPVKGRYWFYCSYSRIDIDPYLRKFFTDLQTEIRLRLGLSTDENIGFFDADKIEPGDAWPIDVAEALRSSRSMICLLSPSYVQSEWCGRELQVFRQRMALQSDSSPLIFPLLWFPLGERVPSALTELQWADARFPKRYIEEGLRYLMRLSRFRDDYLDLLSRFAEILTTRVERSDLPILEEVPALGDVPNAFEEPHGLDRRFAGPSRVEFFFAVASRDEIAEVRKGRASYGFRGADWRPFSPSVEAEIAGIAQNVAAEESLRYTEIDPAENLFQRMIVAERQNTVVAIIVDPWTLELRPYRKLLSEIDRHTFLNCAIFCLWDNEDEETRVAHQHLEEVVEATFYLGKTMRSIFMIQSFEEFRHQLRGALHSVRMAILEHGNVPSRAEEAAVKRPILRGPGEKPA